MEMPKGMKMIAMDFDQEVIATRIRETIGEQIDEMMSSQLEELKDQITLEEGDNQVIVRLMGESTFDSGKAEIRQQLIRQVIGYIKRLPGNQLGRQQHIERIDHIVHFHH